MTQVSRVGVSVAVAVVMAIGVAAGAAAQVLEYTAQMCALDERAQLDKRKVGRLQRAVRRSTGRGDELGKQAEELAQLKMAVAEAAEKKGEMQVVTDAAIEKLYELSHALDATDEQHNDDSLLQFMLFSAA